MIIGCMVKIYLIATEPSGDFIGACLIKKLKRITKNRVIFYGIGGNKMIKEGLNKTLFPINKLSLLIDEKKIIKKIPMPI